MQKKQRLHNYLSVSFNVTALLSMERIKSTTAYPVLPEQLTNSRA